MLDSFLNTDLLESLESEFKLPLYFLPAITHRSALETLISHIDFFINFRNITSRRVAVLALSGRKVRNNRKKYSESSRGVLENFPIFPEGKQKKATVCVHSYFQITRGSFKAGKFLILRDTSKQSAGKRVVCKTNCKRGSGMNSPRISRSGLAPVGEEFAVGKERESVVKISALAPKIAEAPARSFCRIINRPCTPSRDIFTPDHTIIQLIVALIPPLITRRNSPRPLGEICSRIYRVCLMYLVDGGRRRRR